MKIYLNKYDTAVFGGVEVVLPWYLKPIALYDHQTKTLTIGVWHTMKFWAEGVWYWPAQAIHKYNVRDCVNYIPDLIQMDGSMGTKVRPFLGFFIKLDENAAVERRWWKNLKRVK